MAIFTLFRSIYILSEFEIFLVSNSNENHDDEKDSDHHAHDGPCEVIVVDGERGGAGQSVTVSESSKIVTMELGFFVSLFTKTVFLYFQ